MSKLGFMQDLIRGIKKITSSIEPSQPPVQPVVVAAGESSVNVAALLDRAQLALEDGEWNRADDFCEQVLNADARNATAYFYKLLAELHVYTEDDLNSYTKPFSSSRNYQKAVRFGNDELCNFLSRSNTEATARAEFAKQEAKRKEMLAMLEAERNETYNKAALAAERAVTKQDYEATARLFESLDDYRDSAQRAESLWADWVRIEEVAKDIVNSYGLGNGAQKPSTELELLLERRSKLEAEKASRPALVEKQLTMRQSIAALEQQLAQLRAKRSSLGMLAFSDRREVDAQIASAEKRLGVARSTLIQIENSLRTLLDPSTIDTELKKCDQLIDVEKKAEIKRTSVASDGVRHTEADLRDPRVLEHLRTAYPKEYFTRLVLLGLVNEELDFGFWGGESIRWRILVREADRVLLISARAIDCMRFDRSNNNWNTSELKRWLEDEFEAKAFSGGERHLMGSHPFCLDVKEARRYFAGDADRVCRATAYAKKQGAWCIAADACGWWLRSAVKDFSTALSVSTDGKVVVSGNSVSVTNIAVRPALWMKI